MSEDKTVEQVIGEVLCKYNLCFRDLQRRGKRGVLGAAKKELCYRLYTELRIEQTEIASIIGLKNKSTVSLAIGNFARKNGIPLPKYTRTFYKEADIWAVATHLAKGSGRHLPEEVFNLLKKMYHHGYRTGYQCASQKFNKLSKTEATSVPPE